MNLKSMLNQQLDLAKPAIDAEIDRLAAQGNVAHSATALQQQLLTQLDHLKNVPVFAKIALQLAIQTFDFSKYASQGQIQVDKLATDLKKHVDGARL